MLNDSDPIWRENEYTPYGKWMDGWESRRRRTEGNDWCIVALGITGMVHAIEVNTAFFTGNFSPKVRICGAYLEEKSVGVLVNVTIFAELTNKLNIVVNNLLQRRKESVQIRPEHGRMGLCADAEDWALVSSLDSESWPELVPLTPLGAGYPATQKSLFEVAPLKSCSQPITHIRVDMGPDGGIARLRVYGRVRFSLTRPLQSPVDLAAVEHGGLALVCTSALTSVSSVIPVVQLLDRLAPTSITVTRGT